MVNCRQVASPERNFDSLSFALISIPKAGSLYAVELPSEARRLFGLKYGLTTKFFENLLAAHALVPAFVTEQE